MSGPIEGLNVLHSDKRRAGVLAELDGRHTDRLPQDVDEAGNKHSFKVVL